MAGPATSRFSTADFAPISFRAIEPNFTQPDGGGIIYKFRHYRDYGAKGSPLKVICTFTNPAKMMSYIDKKKEKDNLHPESIEPLNISKCKTYVVCFFSWSHSLDESEVSSKC